MENSDLRFTHAFMQNNVSDLIYTDIGKNSPPWVSIEKLISYENEMEKYFEDLTLSIIKIKNESQLLHPLEKIYSLKNIDVKLTDPVIIDKTNESQLTKPVPIEKINSLKKKRDEDSSTVTIKHINPLKNVDDDKSENPKKKIKLDISTKLS